jgi:hypothetical protein
MEDCFLGLAVIVEKSKAAGETTRHQDTAGSKVQVGSKSAINSVSLVM